MTIGINTSPLAGQVGKKLTARQVSDRLQAELVGNVSIRVLDTERPDTWEVQGRGELQLGVLVEAMRREGFELTVGKPKVVTREVNGKLQEPIERLAIDMPRGLPRHGHAAHGAAQGPHGADGQPRHRLGAPRVPRPRARADRLPHGVPHRDARLGDHALGLRALRELAGRDQDARRPARSIADRRGKTASFALMRMQERGQLFVGPGEEVYEGMICGANARADDLDVNAIREKKQTNIRSANADEMVNLVPPARMSLDQALEFIREDECVEVTPDSRAAAQGAADRRRPREGGALLEEGIIVR